MWRLWEHINRIDSLKFITLFLEQKQVANHCCRIARNINDLLRSSLNCRINKFRCQPFSRWINKNHIGLHTLFRSEERRVGKEYNNVRLWYVIRHQEEEDDVYDGRHID